MVPQRFSADIHLAIADFVGSGNPFALVTVLRASGSVPREAGTKAIVDHRGTIWETIGGGLLESETQRLAIEAMRENRPHLFDFQFTGASATGSDPVCGGVVRVLIDPTVSRQPAAYLDAAHSLRERQRGVLVTTVRESGRLQTTIQWLGPDNFKVQETGSPQSQAAQRAWQDGAPHFFTEPAADSHFEGLAERLIPQPFLIIAGGGHVGRAIAEHARLVGFDVVLMDDRAEFADPQLGPQGVTVRCGDPSAMLSEYPLGPDTYVAVVGRGHIVDSKVLAACLEKPLAYLGMMGSRRKVALLKREFLESGRATSDQWGRLHAPIGLDIGAETVPEIAASVVAELVAVRRTGQCTPRLRST